MPKVSIIIPVFNKDKYISMTIESILAQKFTDYEVIVVNDGSTDNSLQILKKYEEKDSRLFVINIPNSGVSNARNVGLNYASGEWIQFLDGDDKIDEDYLLNAVNIAESFVVDVLFTNFQMVDSIGRVVKEVEVEQTGCFGQNELCHFFATQQYENGFYGYISNKLIRKSVLEKSGAKFPVDIKLAEDLDFFVNLYPVVEKACFLDRNSFYYLQTENNYLFNEKIDYISQLKIQLDIKQWFVKSDCYLKYQRILDRKISDYVFFSLFHARENNLKIKEVYQKIVNNKDIMKSLSWKGFKGFSKVLLCAVKRRDYVSVFFLLNSRETVRIIYRRLKNG